MHVKDWEQDDKRKLRHVKKTLMQAAAPERLILITTTGKVNSDVIKGWGDGNKFPMKVIPVLVDEAQGIKKASTWGVLFTSIWRGHIVITFLAGDNTQVTPKSQANAPLISGPGAQAQKALSTRLIAGGVQDLQLDHAAPHVPCLERLF